MLYVISGCSGGGKSTLINALSERGFNTSKEPGRQIVREEQTSGGEALPWNNPVAFSERCAELSEQLHDSATQSGKVVFFDRSLVDAISALIHLEPDRAEAYSQRLQQIRYASTVFMAPPWPEIYENDPERRHGFEEAVAEYDRLVVTYATAGYSILLLPKSSIAKRTNFVLQHVE